MTYYKNDKDPDPSLYPNRFLDRLWLFLDGCESIRSRYYKEHFPSLVPDRIKTKFFSKHVMLYNDDAIRSPYCFVAVKLGDIRIRRIITTNISIYEPDLGLSIMDAFGVVESVSTVRVPKI